MQPLNTRTKRIAFFEPYPMGMGGNFVTQRLILERLDRTRFCPIVISPGEGPALARFRRIGVECIVLPPPRHLDRYGGAIARAGLFERARAVVSLIRYNFELFRLFRERRIDLVYNNCVRAQVSTGFAARLARVPTLLYVKGELANPLIDRVCFVLADKILFQCRLNRDDKYPTWVRWFSRKIDILRSGLDPKLIEEARLKDKTALRKELQIDASHLSVGVMGQLYRPKGQHLAIESLSRIVGEHPNVRLYIIGDPVVDEYRHYREELKDLVAREGLEKNVRFVGWRSDSLDILSIMDIVIHPSLAEGCSRVVLEAMALGRPVIASSVGGQRELIRNEENGFLVAPGDVGAIARCWRELLRNAELRERIGQEARRTVFADYLIDDKVSRLADIWSAMTAGEGLNRGA